MIELGSTIEAGKSTGILHDTDYCSIALLEHNDLSTEDGMFAPSEISVNCFGLSKMQTTML